MHYLVLALLALLPLHADAPLFQPPEPEELIVHNRILAKIDSKTISVIDVMKKMDLFLEKHYPQLVHSKAARYQFYAHEWRDYLNQIVDQELILADAEHLELKLAEAEVREEILSRFGPNIMPVLDRLGMSYDEVRKMVRDEMIMQRMMWLRVHSKALAQINSDDIKHAYNDFCIKNPALEEWTYDVLSIRPTNEALSAQVATQALAFLEQHLDLDAIKTELSSEPDLACQLSSDLKANEKTISSQHKEVLVTLVENAYSPPVRQVSRLDKSVVYRIFHLKHHEKKELPPFTKVAERIKDDLLQKAAEQQNTQYLAKLRERLGYSNAQVLEGVAADFEPFSLR